MIETYPLVRKYARPIKIQMLMDPAQKTPAVAKGLDGVVGSGGSEATI